MSERKLKSFTNGYICILTHILLAAIPLRRIPCYKCIFFFIRYIKTVRVGTRKAYLNVEKVKVANIQMVLFHNNVYYTK